MSTTTLTMVLDDATVSLRLDTGVQSPPAIGVVMERC
jgi:hypothetical protein